MMLKKVKSSRWWLMIKAAAGAAIGIAVAAAMMGCTASQIEEAAFGGAKSWCRNSPQYCSVADPVR